MIVSCRLAVSALNVQFIVKKYCCSVRVCCTYIIYTFAVLLSEFTEAEGLWFMIYNLEPIQSHHAFWVGEGAGSMTSNLI